MLIAIFFISVLLFWVSNRTFILCDGSIANLNSALDNLLASLQSSPFSMSFDTDALLVSGMVASVPILFWLYSQYDFKSTRYNEEHGSACWGTKKSNLPYRSKNKKENILLSKDICLSLFRVKKPIYNRNKNILVIGGSGSGKTRGFLKPQLMQLHSSYVITDPKGSVLKECGYLLKKAGYRILYFNTVNFKQSMHYNPFAYIREEDDILRLVEALMSNTSGNEKQKEDFWVKAERLLYCALIGYIWYECNDDEKNFSTLLLLLSEMKASSDENFTSSVDILFENLAAENPQHFAVMQYTKYKQAAGDTAKSILISCGARLAPFDFEKVREITSYDELNLSSIGDEKTALFFITEETDDTYNFLVGLALTQLFNELIRHAKECPGTRLPIHVRVLADEIMNICQIPNLQKLTAIIRSYEISLCPIIQNISQIKALYKDNTGTIIGNCDTQLFLGSSEQETTKSISAFLGKETVLRKGQSESRGKNGSTSYSQQINARDLMTPDEVATMPNDECIVMIRGERPYRDKKYDITKHPNYKYLSDYTHKDFEYWKEDSFFNDNAQIICSVTVDELNALSGADEKGVCSEENIPENDRFLDIAYFLSNFPKMPYLEGKNFPNIC